jgi:hypothetical protein
MELSGYSCSVIHNEKVWSEKLKAHTLTGFSMLVTTGVRVARLWSSPDETYRVSIQEPFGIGRRQITKNYVADSLDEAAEWLQKEMKK